MNDINKYYQIIGVSENVSDEELYQAYLVLRNKYQNDRFLEGEAGNEAAKKLTELNTAYNEICDYRKELGSGENGASSAISEVDSLIKAGKINEAQAVLDNFSERSAEWHYLQSVVFYKKNWINESKKQLEIAIEMDGDNQKYKTAYEKLCKQINYNAQNAKNSSNANWNQSGSNGGNNNYSSNYEEPTDMMGGDSCADFCCRMAICNILLNCCCNCR
ncbi:MAG: hypothetical protein IJW13_00040 [Clostridia bacterium]|nr:hypothetical protein [Clostridia bacterium]